MNIMVFLLFSKRETKFLSTWDPPKHSEYLCNISIRRRYIRCVRFNLAYNFPRSLKFFPFDRRFSMMESSPKRARQVTTDPARLQVWERLVKKLLRLVIPLNLLLERFLGKNNNGPDQVVATISTMDRDDLIYIREMADSFIDQRRIEENLSENERFSLVDGQTSRTSSPTPTPTSPETTRTSRRPASSSRILSGSIPEAPGLYWEMLHMGQSYMLIDVKGVEVLFGKIPECQCKVPAGTLVVNIDGPHVHKVCWVCNQQSCKYFQWTRNQPLQELRNWKYLQQPGGGPVSHAEVIKMMVQDQCSHEKTTKAGSNAHVLKERCLICEKMLKDERRQKSGATSQPPATAREIKQFQQFLQWQSQQEK